MEYVVVDTKHSPEKLMSKVNKLLKQYPGSQILGGVAVAFLPSGDDMVSTFSQAMLLNREYEE